MRLVDAGCKVVMPWAAPIGSARGIINRDALKLLRDRLPDITLVVDAGLGAPSHAAQALELGYDAVLLNTAIAKAADPVAMAKAFRGGVEAGRAAYRGRADGSPRLRLPFNPCRWDTVLACRILIATRIRSLAYPDRFYPVVDSVAWVARLALLGVGTIQLRAKNLDDVRGAADGEATRSRSSRARRPNSWSTITGARRSSPAPGICISARKISPDADLKAIRDAGLTLGISTHDDEELETALRAKPDYIALGPIFPTTLKSMRFAPQGIPKITEWKKRIGDIPLVAIGGIKLEQAARDLRRRRRLDRRRQRRHAKRRPRRAGARLARTERGGRVMMSHELHQRHCERSASDPSRHALRDPGMLALAHRDSDRVRFDGPSGTTTTIKGGSP